jgi:hypothetical protein
MKHHHTYDSLICSRYIHGKLSLQNPDKKYQILCFELREKSIKKKDDVKRTIIRLKPVKYNHHDFRFTSENKSPKLCNEGLLIARNIAKTNKDTKELINLNIGIAGS